ncbi:unnamed protein product, partial [Linum tenue]
ICISLQKEGTFIIIREDRTQTRTPKEHWGLNTFFISPSSQLKLYTLAKVTIANHQSRIISSISTLNRSFTHKHQLITIPNHLNIIDLNPIHSRHLTNPDPEFLFPQVKQLLKRLRKHHKLPRIASLLRATYRHSRRPARLASIPIAHRKQGSFLAAITIPVLRSC